MTKSGIYLITAAALFSLLPVSGALAGKVEVINENQKELEIKIKAEGSMTENLAEYIQKIPREHKSEFTVESSNLKGKAYYSIRGKTNLFTSSTCDHLSVEKDYKVTFQNDTVGTTCRAEEMAR